MSRVMARMTGMYGLQAPIISIPRIMSLQICYTSYFD